MGCDRPYRPDPALQRVLDEINRVGNLLDRMTAENVGALWALREGSPAGPARLSSRLPAVLTIRAYERDRD